MYHITGFSRFRVIFIALFFAFVCSVGNLAISAYFPINTNPALSFLLAFILTSLIFLVQVYAFKLKVDKHRSIMKHLLDEINDVIVFKDFDGNFVFCNETVAKLYNSTPEDMIGKDDFFFTKNKEQTDFFRENVRDIMRRGVTEDVYESSTDAATGEIRHFHSMKIPYRDARNRMKILVIAKDITELVSLREESDKNKRRLEHVLDVSEEGLWEWNIQTNEVLHNEQWSRILGIEDTQETFAEFENAIIAEDKPKVQEALRRLMEENRPYSIEFRMKRPDGKFIWVWDRGRVAEYDSKGSPVWIAGICQDITIQKRNQDKITSLAYNDQLTGLVNRSQLMIELDNTIKLSKEKNRYSSVLFLDLDRFKLLNDSYGHHLGDKLLIEVSQRLQQVNASQGIVSRFGGDEFVIILSLLSDSQKQASEITHRYAHNVIDKMLKPYTLISDVQELQIEYSITCSIGGVVFEDQDISSEKLLQLADMALYRAKTEGGNLARIFDTEMQDELYQASELQKEMYESIAQRNFIIYLQPQYNVQEDIIGAEALVRWNHPVRGILAPGAFIDMAEESNLIIPIGNMVFEQACQQLERWQASEQTKDLTISVNLSAKQIWQNTFVEDCISLIESYSIDHTKLILEVTESLLIRDIDDAMQKLTRLKEYGLTISLDDFGTGYSSLSYIRSLPIDEIKIDRSFVNDLASSKQSAMMVKSIIDLANNFDLTVVSEGIEDTQQLDILKEYGIPVYQGFYFSRPLAVDKMDELLGLVSDS